jgi:hypothetical protein
MAAHGLGDAVTVTLNRPVAPGSTAVVDQLESETVLRTDDAIAATAVPSRFTSTAPDPVELKAAERASSRYPGFEHHHFPNCFCCGPNRSAGSGLRIFPGPVDGRQLVAAIWRPDASLRQADGGVAAEIVWAALDCPAIWGYVMHGNASADESRQTLVLTGRGVPMNRAAWT